MVYPVTEMIVYWALQVRLASGHLLTLLLSTLPPGAKCFLSRQAMAQCYHALFQAHGTCSAPRFGGQVLAGLEMAMWDAAGKTAGCAVHELLGETKSGTAYERAD